MRLLRPTLNYGNRTKCLEFVSSAPERPAQLLLLQVRPPAVPLVFRLSVRWNAGPPTETDSPVSLLQNSLLKLDDFQLCLECSELALNEALQQLNSASHSGPPTKEEWVCTIRRLLEGIELCFGGDPELLSKVPQFSSMARLANNLIQVGGVTAGTTNTNWISVLEGERWMTLCF